MTSAKFWAGREWELWTLDELARRRDADEALPDPLVCSDCDAQVRFTKAHTRNRGGVEENVAASIGLKAGHDHVDCRYSIRSRVIAFVREARAIGEIDEIIEALEGDQFRVRLGSVHQALIEASAEPDDDLAEGDIEQHARDLPAPGPARQVRGRLAHHLSTAAEVARLRAIIEDESEDKAGARELERRLQLMHNGCAIRWSDFFYRLDRLDELFKRLREHGVEHPVAFEFLPVQRFPADGPPYSAIRGAKATNSGPKELPLTSWLDLSPPQIAARIPERQPIMVLGMPTASIARGKYRNLRVDIFRSSQVSIV